MHSSLIAVYCDSNDLNMMSNANTNKNNIYSSYNLTTGTSVMRTGGLECDSGSAYADTSTIHKYECVLNATHDTATWMLLRPDNTHAPINTSDLCMPGMFVTFVFEFIVFLYVDPCWNYNCSNGGVCVANYTDVPPTAYCNCSTTLHYGTNCTNPSNAMQNKKKKKQTKQTKTTQTTRKRRQTRTQT